VDSSSSKTAYSDEFDLATNGARVRGLSSDTYGTESVIASISEHVENELFLSLKTHLTDYTSILIKDGANNTTSSARDGKMHEVRRQNLLVWQFLEVF
jgi:hypothetical protein